MMPALTTTLAAAVTLRRVLVLTALLVGAISVSAHHLRKSRRNAVRRHVKAAYNADPQAAARAHGHPNYAAWLDARFDDHHPGGG